eukprot:85040_1
MEDFVRAVVVSNNPSTQRLDRERAVTYFDSLRRSPESWKLAVQVLENDQDTVVHFSAWMLLSYSLEIRWSEMSLDDRMAARTWVWNFVKNSFATDQDLDNLNNKIAALLIALCKLEYPETWPTFFSDLMSLLHLGPRALAFVLRALDCFDEDVVTFDDRRPSALQTRCTFVKDHMRDSGVVAQLVELWIKVLSELHQSQPQLARQCLHTANRFAKWIDWRLLLNERFLSLVFQCLNAPATRNEAVISLRTLAHRRMDPGEKLTALKTLNVLEVVAALSGGEDDEVSVSLADLLSVCGHSLIDCFANRQELNGSQQQECSSMLNRAMELAIPLTSHKNYEVVREIVEFTTKYMSQLTDLHSVDSALAVFRLTFSAATEALRLPDGYNALDPSDSEADFDQFRVRADNLFKTLLTTNREVALVLLNEQLTKVLQQIKEVPFTHVEVVLNMVSLTAEHLRGDIGEFVKTGVFADILRRVFSGSVLQCEHRLVSVIFFNLLSKCGSVFLENNPDMFNTILTFFMDRNGIQNPDKIVRARASYFILRLVEQLSQNMQTALCPSVGQIVQGVLCVLNEYIAQSSPHTLEDVSNLCQLIGVLTKPKIVGTEKSLEYMAAVLAPIQRELIKFAESKDQWIASQTQFVGDRAADLSELVSSLTKSFGNDSDNPKMIFISTLELLMSIMSLIPSHERLRSSTMSVIHHLIPCLGTEIFGMLPAIYETFMKCTNSSTIIDILNLNQRLVVTFQTGMLEFMDVLLMKIVQFFFSCLAELDSVKCNGHTPESALSQLKADRISLLKNYYQFIISLVRNGLCSIFVSERNAPHLRQIVGSVLEGTMRPPDASIHAACFEILRRMVEHWQQFAPVSGFAEFFVSAVVERSFSTLQLPHISSKDAASGRCMREIGALHHQMIQTFSGDDFATSLAAHLADQLRVERALACDYCLAVSKGNKNKTRKALAAVSDFLRTQAPR